MLLATVIDDMIRFDFVVQWFICPRVLVFAREKRAAANERNRHARSWASRSDGSVLAEVAALPNQVLASAARELPLLGSVPISATRVIKER